MNIHRFKRTKNLSINERLDEFLEYVKLAGSIDPNVSPKQLLNAATPYRNPEEMYSCLRDHLIMDGYLNWDEDSKVFSLTPNGHKFIGYVESERKTALKEKTDRFILIGSFGVSISALIISIITLLNN